MTARVRLVETTGKEAFKRLKARDARGEEKQRDGSTNATVQPTRCVEVISKALQLTVHKQAGFVIAVTSSLSYVRLVINRFSTFKVTSK